MTMAQAVEETHETDHEEQHEAIDPNAAPMHHEIQSSFTLGQMAVAWGLGAIAIVAGVILGLTAVNN